MSSDNRQILESFLASPARPARTLGFHELQGFLFAIACAPELIMPSEWMPVIFDEEDAGYADMDEAESVTTALMDVYNDINRQVLEGNVTLPANIKLEKRALDNVGEQTALGQWSQGFYMGHDWLIELWDGYLPPETHGDELDEELGGCLMILSLFASRQIAEACHGEVLEINDESLADFVARLLALFEDAMASYALLGRSIYEAVLQRPAPQPRENPNKHIGRNDPCPCGSGRKFKQCCLQ